MKCFNLFFMLGWLIMLSACRPSVSENEYQIRIQLSEDRKRVVVSNLPAELMEESSAGISWNTFFAVYEKTDDPDLADLQASLPGTYLIKGNQLEFSPQTPFKKGYSYEARVLIQSLNMETFGMLQRGKWQEKKEGVRFTFSY